MAVQFNGAALPSGWWVLRHKGLDAAPEASLPTLTLPDRGLDLETTDQVRYAPRTCSITFGVRATSYSAFDTALAALKRVLLPDPVVLTLDRRPGQQLTVRALTFPVDNGIGGQEIPPFYAEVEVGFRAINPFWEDSTAQAVAFDATDTVVPQGTGDVDPVLLCEVTGASVTGLVLTYKNADGDTVATVTVDLTIAAGDAFELDCAAETARKRVSGVWSNAIDTLDLGFTYPRFSPRDGTSPTIAVAKTGGSGSVAGTATYRRAWA